MAQAQRLRGQARLDSINAAYYARDIVPAQPVPARNWEAERLKKKALTDSANAAYYARDVVPVPVPQSPDNDMFVGPRGGVYRINKNGGKTYIKRK